MYGVRDGERGREIWGDGGKGRERNRGRDVERERGMWRYSAHGD